MKKRFFLVLATLFACVALQAQFFTQMRKCILKTVMWKSLPNWNCRESENTNWV